MDWTENECLKKQLMSKEKLGKRLPKSFKHYCKSTLQGSLGKSKETRGESRLFHNTIKKNQNRAFREEPRCRRREEWRRWLQWLTTKQKIGMGLAF